MTQKKFFMLFLMLFLLMFCSECKKNEISLVERFADYLVFSPGELKDAAISFSDTNKGKTPDFLFQEVKFSDSTFILFPHVRSKKHLTLGELEDIGIVIPLQCKSKFLEKWFNETITVEAKICIPAADTIVLPETSIPDTRLNPDCEAKLNLERSSQSFLCYNIVITATGEIWRYNYCHACGTIVCEFMGDGIIAETTPPNRPPDFRNETDCGGRKPDDDEPIVPIRK